MADQIKRLRVYPDLDGKTHLICVGAAKCATSWLHHYLGGMATVAVSPLKEVHFFNARFPANALGNPEALALARLSFHLDQEGDVADNLLQRPTFQASVDRVQMIYDDNAYFAHFARLSTPDTRCSCDLTPAYSAIGTEGFSYIRRFCAAQNCETKILFVMRDPIERFWSQLRHLQQMNPANDIVKDWPDALTSAALNARADYAATVSALDETFAPGNVLYLFYETLFETETLRRLCTFAGVPFTPGTPDEAKNATTVKTALPEAARQALHRHLAPQYQFCRDRFGDAVPPNWQR